MMSVRRTILLLLVAVLSLGTPAAGAALATAPPDPSTAAPPLQTSPPLERPESECVGHAVQLPGCGYEPQQPGDRGGWMQWTLFGMMLVGLAFIGWRVVVGVRRTAARDA